MPPKRKRSRQAPKAPLLFLQQPLEGPRRHSGEPPHPVTHTREVPSRPIDHSTITSWVTPQFDTAAGSDLPDHRKRQRRDRARRSTRKSAPKFPHLSFENPEPSLSSATRSPPSFTERPPQPEKIRRSPLVPVLSPQSQGESLGHTHPSFPQAFTPPDIQTPGPASVGQGPATPAQRPSNLPGRSLHRGAPKGTEPTKWVLVEDTPEEKYGLKVTWRRRQQLLTYLQETGKLSGSQVHVKI